MKLHIKKEYFKNIRRGKEPCKYVATQPQGVNSDVYATIKLDPILRKKKLKPIKDAMIGHEIHEIRAWGEGKNAVHRRANNREPAITRIRIKGVSGFWDYCEQMKKKGEL